jgi:hypothetical protein
MALVLSVAISSSSAKLVDVARRRVVAPAQLADAPLEGVERAQQRAERARDLVREPRGQHARRGQPVEALERLDRSPPPLFV